MAKKDGYNGNLNLKKTKTNIEFTEKEAIEYVKCMNDPIYFIKNYVKIVNVDKGLVPLELWPFQEKLIRTVVDNRMSVHKLSRQIGKCCLSTTVVKVRNKKTGEISQISLKDLHDLDK